MILSRTPSLYARAYDRGRCEARLDSARLAEAQIYERPNMSRMTQEAFGVGIETVLRLAGRKDVLVTSQPTVDGAAYSIRLQ